MCKNINVCLQCRALGAGNWWEQHLLLIIYKLQTCIQLYVLFIYKYILL